MRLSERYGEVVLLAKQLKEKLKDIELQETSLWNKNQLRIEVRKLTTLANSLFVAQVGVTLEEMEKEEVQRMAQVGRIAREDGTPVSPEELE